MKISWLRKLNENSSLNNFVWTWYPDLGKLSMLGGEFSNIIMQKIHNMFWRDVLRHYKRLCTKCSPTNVDEFMCIHYNTNIKRGRRVVYVKEWFDADILFLHQKMTNDGRFLTFQEFKVHFPTTVNTNFLVYTGTIKAIRD